MITLIKKIAIREHILPANVNLDDPDPSPWQNVVILTNVMEGVDGAATFGYSLETVAVQVEDNQTQQYKHIHTFDVRVLDAGGDNATIDGWILDQKLVDIAGIGVDGYFQFTGVKLTRNKQYDEVFASAFLATAETVTSYAAPNHNPIWFRASSGTIERYSQRQLRDVPKYRATASPNLYGLFDLDVNRSNIDGYGQSVWQNGTYYAITQSENRNTNITTSSVNGSNVTITRQGDGTTMVDYEQVFFPFGGETLTASINVVDVNNESGGAFAQIGTYERGDNAQLNITNEVNITAAGRKSFDITTNSNTRVVWLRVRPGTKKDSNITFDDIGIYTTASAPFDPAKSSPTSNTNASSEEPYFA